MDMHHTYGNFDFISWDPKTMYTLSTSLPVPVERETTTNTTFIPLLPKAEYNSQPPVENHNFKSTSSENRQPPIENHNFPSTSSENSQPPIENHNFNSTSSETSYECNMKDHTGQLIYCEICGYSSIYKEDLKNHKKTHEHSCKRCDKTFKRKMHLKVHMLQHTGERPYKCSLCDRNFKLEAHLNRHTHWHNLKIIAGPEKCSSNTFPQDKILASNIDHIFNYVVNKKYPSGMTHNNRSNLRSLSKQYSTQSGKLYYRHRAKKVEDFGNEYKELLVILDQDEQKRIIQNVHMGTEESDDSKPDRCIKNHLGIESTRLKILQKFYWKNVGRDVRDFILACTSCDRWKKPVYNSVYKINIGRLCKSKTASKDKANNMDTDEHNISTASEEEHDNIDDDEHNSSIEVQNKAENIDNDEHNSSIELQNKTENIDVDEHNSSIDLQSKADNIDLVFDYVINKKYTPGLTKNQKGNIRLLASQYFERDGQLVYRHKAKRSGKKSGNEYTELLIIRNKDEQKSIIKSMHIDLEDHLGIHRTRAKILEKFYWKNVGNDVKDFISACDRCHKTQPVRKINMDMIFEYVVNNKYIDGMSKDDKGNLRKISKQYIAQTGQLYYRHKAERFGDSADAYRELLVVREKEEQIRIIKDIHKGPGDNSTSHTGSKVSSSPPPSLLSIMKSIHTGSKDSDPANLKSNTANLKTNITNSKTNTANLKNDTATLKNHFGFEKTRTKILEKYFWRTVGKDVKEFISGCDQCNKLRPARKSNDPVIEPLKIMTQIWG